MQKFAITLVVTLLVASLLAQPTTLPGELVISDLRLTGAHLSRGERQSIIDEVKNGCCRMNQSEEVKERILYAFQERGYVKAKVLSLDILRRSPGRDHDTVAVSASLDEGPQYRLKEISFFDAKAFPKDKLRNQFRIADGDIFNTEKIRDGLEDLRELYASQGYLTFVPVPNSDTHEETATITLEIDVDEGSQFHSGKLVLDGEEPRAGTSAKLIDAWKPYEGNLFDPEVAGQYWKVAQKILPPGLEQKDTLAVRFDFDSATAYPRIDFPDPK